jgi:hypothetical protein
LQAYCIDTSAILDGWVRYYPIDSFPGLWMNLDELIDAGRLVTSDEVLRELEAKEDEALKWAKGRPKLFVPLDESFRRQRQRSSRPSRGWWTR